MITLSHLTMRFTGGGHQITILDDVTLEIPDKQRVLSPAPPAAENPLCWVSSRGWTVRPPAPSR